MYRRSGIWHGGAICSRRFTISLKKAIILEQSRMEGKVDVSRSRYRPHSRFLQDVIEEGGEMYLAAEVVVEKSESMRIRRQVDHGEINHAN
jgi:hypothetical protein